MDGHTCPWREIWRIEIVVRDLFSAFFNTQSIRQDTVKIGQRASGLNKVKPVKSATENTLIGEGDHLWPKAKERKVKRFWALVSSWFLPARRGDIVSPEMSSEENLNHNGASPLPLAEEELMDTRGSPTR